MGRGGIQYTANQGQEWTSIRTTSQEGDFQVSKRVKLAYKKKGVSSKDNACGVRTCAFDMCVFVPIKVVFRL
jgi:hypothetical protein